jgi:SWI/SNF-related matrix-associated actin-dependent regulator of chromatin subfamily A3
MSPNSRNIPVLFQYPNSLISKGAPSYTTFEIASNEESAILAELESAEEITTQLYCHPKQDPYLLANINGKQRGKTLQKWFVNAIIYGDITFEEAVGDFLSKRRMYLQDPIGCDRNVLYRNPHIIYHGVEDIVMTDSLESALGMLEIERLEAGPDLLSQLMEDEDPLQETDAPVNVETDLFRWVLVNFLTAIFAVLKCPKVTKSKH